MELHAQQIIGFSRSAEGTASFHGTNPATGEKRNPAFPEATPGEINRALTAAEKAFDAFRATSSEDKAKFLEAIADEIEALGDVLLETGSAETGLPIARLTGERGRTVNQTRLFAKEVRDGSWIDARIDRANPDRKPVPKPDVRMMLMPIGPVVVFGASNFPLAISVAGTDTVCAFGAGCPVVVKAHPAHPATCELVAGAVVKAARDTGMPDGIFSLLHGVTYETGLAMVRHPAAKAVAFTGSLGGGRALYNAAAAREEPIPVYAEMGSINPVFVLPGALAERANQIAAGYIQSVTLGVGQFCTNPGLVLGLESDALEGFKKEVSKVAGDAAPATMLHAGIHSAYGKGTDRIAKTSGVEVLGQSTAGPEDGKTQAPCIIFSTDAITLSEQSHLFEEVFGPTSVVVSCPAPADLEKIAEGLEGHLSATVHGTEEDLKAYAGLIRILERKAGRLIFNGFPTGIEVCAAMHHGGPYPAATDSHFTSIGTRSILRFARPVCYQDFPQDALPIELRDKNPSGIWRRIDNELTQNDV